MRFTADTVIRATPERVFAFHAQPDAFARLTPPWAGVRVLSETSSVQPGSTTRAKLRVLPLIWVTGEYVHTVCEPPFLFEDRQVHGAFKSWWHRHVIEPHPDGARLIDDVEFEPPGGFLGRLLAPLLILPRLRKIFAWRHEVTRAWCEDQIARSWNVNAAAWSTAVRSESIESRRAGTDEAIVEAVLAQQPETLLDLGCGEGWLARALAARGIAVTGVDGSPALIEAARERGGGEFFVLPYRDLGLLGRDFDVAVANFSLLDETLPSVPAATLVIQTIHPSFAEASGWQVETFATMPGEWKEPMPWYFRTLDSWREALGRLGFEVAETREPRHPESGRALSLILICRRNLC